MKTHPPITIFGLGRMGAQIARRLHAKGFQVHAWNRSPGPVDQMNNSIKASSDLDEVIGWSDDAEGRPRARIFWIMLPHSVVDDFLFGKAHLGPKLRKGDIVIDGGNSFYKLTMKRAEKMKKKGIHYFDCGTSGRSAM